LFTLQDMKRNLFIIGLLLSTVFSWAQNQNMNPPDLKKIGKSIANERSSNWYPKLMTRYQLNDTTLSLQEYRLLYYGYVLQPEFMNKSTTSLLDSLTRLMTTDSISHPDYYEIAEVSARIHQLMPFDMKYLDPLSFALRLTDENDLASKVEFKLGRLVETIYNTGDGMSEQTPFYVISPTHEMDMLRALGFTLAGSAPITSGNIDYIKVKANDYGIQGLFFKRVYP